MADSDKTGYYTREDVRQAIVSHAKGKEIAIRFGDYFGKRPDVLQYPNDVLEAAKKGATSFHNSEEHWYNPLELTTSMRRREQDELRSGWDLIIDIDCKIWDFSKVITDLLIKALRKHGIKTISVKFSGNKGFHIGVPFEAFPLVFNSVETRTLFPEAPKRIAQYLIDYINGPETNYELSRIMQDMKSINEMVELAGKTRQDVTKKICVHCGSSDIAKNDEDLIEFICPSCQSRETDNENKDFIKCPKCDIMMEKMFIKEKGSSCKRCGSKDFLEKFDPLPILEVDTLLISSRHMYRMPYSLHEKSGLVSLPFNPDKVMLFERRFAEIDTIKMKYHFLDLTGVDFSEASMLLQKSWSYAEIKEQSKMINEEIGNKKSFSKDIETLENAAPQELFPPCISCILAGLDDGRKRALFILGNFLSCAGYDWGKIREIMDDWNKKNTDPLRETNINGHVNYHSKKPAMLPPNCRSLYQDLGVCKPDNLCGMIKNPVQYVKRKVKFLENNKKKEKKPKSKKKEEAAQETVDIKD